MGRRTGTVQLWLTPCLSGWFFAAVAIFSGQEMPSVRLNEKTELKFASLQQGQEAVAARDAYVERLGELEIQLRMGSPDTFTKQDYIDRMRSGVIEWDEADIKFIESAMKIIHKRMQSYRLSLPEQILLVRVSAQVEGNAPHCRGASIILPDSFFANAAEAPRTLAHELFHVLSSHNPQLRDRLYGIIHFRPTEEVPLPDALQARRLTNPDAVSNEHVVHLTIDGTETPVMPIILSKTKEFRPGGLFANLDFKLMVLDEQEGKFVAKHKDGRPQLLSPREAPDYLRKIGRNTGYIIHPEEVLADNFALMILNDQVPDARIIDELKEVLQKEQF